MKIEKLEDLQAWVEARRLGHLVFTAAQDLPAEEKYGLKRHMLENSRNIPANIAEGFGRFHYQESIQFYRIARGCLEELRSDVSLCLDRNYFNEKTYAQLQDQLDLVKRLINGLISNSYKAKAGVGERSSR